MEHYEVFLSPKALRDLDAIYAYVAEVLLEQKTAAELIDELENGILSLEQMPYRCAERKVGAYGNRGYRQLFIRNYTVIYRIDEENRHVIVVTVVYSRRDF